MFLIKIKNTIHGKCILYSSIQGGQTTRFSTRFLYSEKSREKSSRLAEALVAVVRRCREKLYVVILSSVIISLCLVKGLII